MQICMILAHLRLNKSHSHSKALGIRVILGVLFSRLTYTYIPACSQLITYATDMWSELMVIKREHGGGRFCNQLGNSGRDRKLKGPRSDNSVRLQGQVPPVTRCSVMLNSCGGERKKERGSSCVLKINSGEKS